MPTTTTHKHEWKDEYTLLCNRCGYIIDDLDHSLPCPECSTPIAQSLPHLREGSHWQQSQSVVTLLRTWITTIAHPFRTLDQIRFSEIHPKEQAIFNIIVATIIITLGAGVFLISSPPSAGIPVTIIAFVFIALVWITLWILTVIEARGLQFFAARRGGRITDQIAWTIVAHGSVGWIITALGIASTPIIVSSYMILTNPTGFKDPSTIPASVLWITLIISTSIALAGFLFFETFAYLGLRRCKYANRSRPKTAPNQTPQP